MVLYQCRRHSADKIMVNRNSWDIQPAQSVESVFDFFFSDYLLALITTASERYSFFESLEFVLICNWRKSVHGGPLTQIRFTPSGILTRFVSRNELITRFVEIWVRFVSETIRNSLLPLVRNFGADWVKAWPIKNIFFLFPILLCPYFI